MKYSAAIDEAIRNLAISRRRQLLMPWVLMVYGSLFMGVTVVCLLLEGARP
jgi:hypothetical protein